MARVVGKISFEKIFLCRGFINSPIDIHEFSLELSHLFGTTSFDSCFVQNQNFHWKPRRMQTDQDMVAYYFLKKEILILRTLNEFFNIKFSKVSFEKNI